MALLEAGSSPPLESVVDPLPLLRRAGTDAVLAGEELAAMASFVRECVQVGEFLRGHAEHSPRLCALARKISQESWETMEELDRALSLSVDPTGALRDEASHRLRTLRASVRAIESRVRDAAHEAARDPALREALQEPVVHYRGGRPVLPVKSSLRDKVPGVLRDVSASGATLFVEPFESARLGRQRERLLKELEREQRRIRRALTRRIAALREDLQRMRGVIGRLEVAFAAGTFGLSRNGVCATLATDGTLDLRNVYHPLLPPGSVPLSVRLDDRTRTLLITGPNTGGKTVALKSIGLAVLMTACGLPVLGEEGTVVPVVEDVLVDIGDEQSIEQSLSTFSSHMSNIVRVIEHVAETTRGHCMVLLDELGAGTDPDEGEALGCAILEWLHATGGSRLRLLATSHFARLKEFAASTEGMANARMEFDPVTLQPTYRLTMGASGASQAFPVASRLGLPQEILSRAEEFLGPERVEFRRLLASLEAERQLLQEARRQVARDAEALGKERQAAREEAEALRAELARTASEFRRDAEEVLAWSRRELKAARAAEGVAAAQRRHVEITRALRAVVQEEPVHAQRAQAKVDVGDEVEVEGVGQGPVVAVDRRARSASVVVRGVRVVVPLDRLRRAQATPRTASAYVTLPEEPVGPELMLLGMRADEARERVVRYLDDARAADLATVRIVHGLGRGVLREVVRDALRSHPSVLKFRPGLPHEGGPGVTLVYLREPPRGA